MHKTAYNIGGLALKIYASCEKARVLEIGAMNVNGSLRDHMRPDMDYIGIDMEEGPGVDLSFNLAIMFRLTTKPST